MPYSRIDPTRPTPPVFANPAFQDWGPWQIGGSLYLVARSGTKLLVYKSADGGGTWTVQDEANTPVLFATPSGASAHYPGSGTTIYLAFGDSLSTLRLKTFSTATDTFGVQSAQVSATAQQLVWMWLARLSGGNQRVYFTQVQLADANRTHCWWAEWNGVVWTVASQVDTNLTGVTSALRPNLLLGTADLIHLWWQNAGGSVFYRQLSAGGLLGAISTIAALGTVTALGRAVIWSGKIALPYDRLAGVGDDRPAVLFGDPEAAPVWASEDIDVTQPSTIQLLATLSGVNLRVWFLEDNGAATQQIWYGERNGGGWTSTLFLDVGANPPTPAPTSQQLFALSFTRLVDTSWLGFFDANVGDGMGGDISTIFITVASPPPPPPPPPPVPPYSLLTQFVPPGAAYPVGGTGLWEHTNGDLYGLFNNGNNIDNPPIPPVPNIYRSQDSGVSWAVADPGTLADWLLIGGGGAMVGQPLHADRLGNFIYVLWTKAFAVEVHELHLSRFNMATNIWDYDFAGAGPQTVGNIGGGIDPTNTPFAHAITTMRVRPDGTVVATYGAFYTAGSWVQYNWVTWDVVNGWVDQGPIPTPDDLASYYPQSVLLDVTTGNLHYFLIGTVNRALVGFPVADSFHHITLRADDTFATFQKDISTDIGTGGLGIHWGMVPAVGVDGGVSKLAIGLLSYSNQAPFRSKNYLFTAPVAEVPAWTTEQLPFPNDPAFDWYYEDLPGNPEASFSVGLVFWQNKLYLFIPTVHSPSDNEGSILWMAVKVSGNWEYTQVFELDESPAEEWMLGSPVPALVTGGLGLFFFAQDLLDPDANQREYYAFFPEVAPPPAATYPAITGTRRMVVLVPNYWDHCLWREVDPARHIPARSVCCVRDPLDYFKWVRMPEGAIEFRKVGAIPTPLAAAGDVLVLRFTVPMGYDGVIHGLTQHYTGPGFLEGNGDIQWRLRINRTYAQYLGNVLVSLGSLSETHPLDDGIPVYSLQQVEYIVSVPNGSGGILPVNSQIVTVCAGFFWPRK